MKLTKAYKQNPWISEAKTHGKAGTLRGESWPHYLKGKKREKGEGIGMPLLFELNNYCGTQLHISTVVTHRKGSNGSKT